MENALCRRLCFVFQECDYLCLCDASQSVHVHVWEFDQMTLMWTSMKLLKDGPCKNSKNTLHSRFHTAVKQVFNHFQFAF